MGKYKRVFAGFLNVRYKRTKDLLSILTFTQVTYLTLSKVGWSNWYLLIIPIIIGYNIFDHLILHKQENDYNLIQSKVFSKLIKDVEQIKKGVLGK